MIQPPVRGLDEGMRRRVERIVAEEAERMGRKRSVPPRCGDERGEHLGCGRVMQRVARALLVRSQQRRRETIVKIDVRAGQAREERGAMAAD